jgi:signal transduction histidine kinase/ligand-binding sensor domain-containing protein
MQGTVRPHRRAYPILIFAGFLLTLARGAQAERLPCKIYTSADGLGSSFVNYVMRDSLGFMWFCTRDGLSRFDGARFITYRLGDQNSPPSIEGITETRNGSYWITTANGLYRFKRDSISQPDATTGSRPTLNAEFIGNYRGSFLEDRQGNLWYGGDALYRLEEQEGKILFQEVELNLPGLPRRAFGIGGMSEAADGSIWLNTRQGLIRRLPDGHLVFYPGDVIATEEYRSLLLDESERIWYVRGAEFYVIKPEPLEALANLGPVTMRVLKPTYVLPVEIGKAIRLPDKAGEILGFAARQFFTRYPTRCFQQTSDKHIWLAAGRELLEFDGQVFHRFTDAQGLPPAMATLAEDSAGNLWIGGRTTLMRFDRKGLISYGEADGFHSVSIHAINETKDGSLYFADSDFYLTRFDGKRFATTRLGLEANAKIMWTSRYAFLDSRNEWWVLTDEKLYRFAATNLNSPLAVYTSRDGLDANSIFQIFEDKRGDIWVSVRSVHDGSNGLARLERGQNRFQAFTKDHGYPAGKSASSFAEDHHGNLWFGFYEGGLARYANQHFTVFNRTDGLPEGAITDLHVDRNGHLWVASSNGGGSRMDDPGAEKPFMVSFTTNDNLSSNNIRTITEDHFGNIYLGSVRGIDRISPVTNRIQHYSVSNGLAGDFVVDSHCDQRGVLWFATTNGLSRLMPTAAEAYATPPIWIGGLSIAGVPQALPELGATEIGTLELLHSQNNLQIDFFGLDFHTGEALRYQYRLEGADTDWRAPTEQRTMTFPNLRPGSYRFLVRALNAQGLASETPAVVSFKILSPVWQRWWFITLAVLLIATAVYAFFRYRVNRLLEIERVRTRIAADLHDDIGASLSHIAVVSEVAKLQLPEEDSQLSKNLSVIARVSGEAVDSMSDIVWAVNPQRDHLYDLTRRMRNFASELLPARDITFSFSAPTEEQDIRVGADVRRQLFLIFKESLNNVVRHSGCSHAEIELHIEGKSLVLKIGDNGKGFDVTNGVRGNGLKNMRRRAESLGGQVELISANGQGTTLRLEMPHHPAHKSGKP